MNKSMKWLLFVVIAAAAAAAFAWSQLSRQARTTDNAYVGADTMPVAAQIAGRVVRVHVKANSAVAAGQPLFDLDDRPYKVAVERAQAKLAQARLQARESVAELAAAQAEAQRVEHLISQAGARLARTHELSRQGFIASQATDDAQAQLSVEVAALEAAKARVRRASTTAYANVEQHPAVLQAAAEVQQAVLDLEYTRITAPAAGRVTNLRLTAGTQVQAHATQFVLVAEDGYWVDANFKEGELPGIVPGLRARVELDAMPGTVFGGVVESISAGTGAAFALLPPQNATGNWVKTAQRVPVRIRLTDVPAERPLPIGASATVRVALR